MNRLVLTILIAFSIAFNPVSVIAKDIDANSIKSIEEAGFGNAAEILKQMSPQQRKQLLKQAESMLGDVQGMSQQELDQFKGQMLQMDNTVDPSDFNVKELDPSKSKGFDGIRQDINTYNKQQQ